MPPSKVYWEYRGYYVTDEDRQIQEGLVVTNTGNIAELAVMLRNKGLQIIEATKLNVSTFKALQRLKNLRASVEVEKLEPTVPLQKTSKIFDVISYIVRKLLFIK